MREGCYTALITPFRDGAVDEIALDRLVELQLEAGVDGIVVSGTTGEAPTTTRQERRHLLRRIRRLTDGRTQVIAGTGTNDTRAAVTRAQEAVEDGADGLLVVTPYYNRPGVEGLRAHFLAVAEAVDRPIMLYDIPSRTGCSLTPTLVAELSAHPNIVSIKDAAGSLGQSMDLIERGLDVLSGDDATTLPGMALGMKGVVSVASNVVPKEMVGLVRSLQGGDLRDAQARHRALRPLFQALFLESNPAPVKALLADLGRCTEEVRLPLTPVGPETKGALRTTYEAAIRASSRPAAAGETGG